MSMLPDNDAANDQLREFKHDVNNQLSNMYLAIEQLRYELDKLQANSFAVFCVDTIANSCTSINKQLDNIK